MTVNNPETQAPVEAFFPFTDIKYPVVFEKHHAQIYSPDLAVDDVDRRELVGLLAENTRTRAGISLADAASKAGDD